MQLSGNLNQILFQTARKLLKILKNSVKTWRCTIFKRASQAKFHQLLTRLTRHWSSRIKEFFHRFLVSPHFPLRFLPTQISSRKLILSEKFKGQRRSGRNINSLSMWGRLYSDLTLEKMFWRVNYNFSDRKAFKTRFKMSIVKGWPNVFGRHSRSSGVESIK